MDFDFDFYYRLMDLSILKILFEFSKLQIWFLKLLFLYKVMKNH